MKKWRLNLPVVLLLLAVTVVACIRIRLLTIPLERDEGEFAYAGQLMLQGIPPYQLLYNMKFPGIYAAYAVMEAVFGQTDGGIRFGLLLVNLLCIALLYRLARHFLAAPAAAAAAAAYALLSTSPVVLGCEAHATHFVVLAALAGLLLLLRGEDSGKFIWFFGGGLLLGVACLMKQPGAVFGVFGFFVLVARAVQKGEAWSIHWRRMTLFAIGYAIPLTLTAVILWRAGVFDRFWFWTFAYASAHAGELPFSSGMRQLWYFLHALPLWGDGLFWMAAVVGLASFLVARGELRKMFWMAGFLVFSAVAVSLSYYFTNHYFVMLLPALCLLAGQAVSVAMQRVRPALVAGVFILMWILTVIAHGGIFFALSPEQVCRSLYGKNPFTECRQIGGHLEENSGPAPASRCWVRSRNSCSMRAAIPPRATFICMTSSGPSLTPTTCSGKWWHRWRRRGRSFWCSSASRFRGICGRSSKACPPQLSKPGCRNSSPDFTSRPGWCSSRTSRNIFGVRIQ